MVEVPPHNSLIQSIYSAQMAYYRIIQSDIYVLHCTITRLLFITNVNTIKKSSYLLIWQRNAWCIFLCFSGELALDLPSSQVCSVVRSLHSSGPEQSRWVCHRIRYIPLNKKGDLLSHARFIVALWSDLGTGQEGETCQSQ